MEQYFSAASQDKRSYRIDLLKAAAIIGVVLYHSGNMETGYLGVEIFFVISGYFFMRSYLQKADKGILKLIPFLSDRILRLWPMVLIISGLSLCLGFFTMLPDDFENLGESVVASSLFANNILSAITTKNYWNLSNNYKPLMHLWYVGVLAQGYVILTFLFYLIDKAGRKVLRAAVFVMMACSLALFLSPSFSVGDKFYYVPFRLYEILTGASVAFFCPPKKRYGKKANIVFGITFLLLCIVMGFGGHLPSSNAVIIEVFLTGIAVYVAVNSVEIDCAFLSTIANIGKASFSIYIVHQPIMAFTRYFLYLN